MIGRARLATVIVVVVVTAGCLGSTAPGSPATATTEPSPESPTPSPIVEPTTAPTSTGSPTASSDTSTSTTETSTKRQTTADESTPTITQGSTEAADSNNSGPHPIRDLDPETYNTTNQAQKAVSFDLPEPELPEGYTFARAAVAMSDDTANTSQEYVALIYANRSDGSTTDWAVVYAVHPQEEMTFSIGENVSIGNRTGAYYTGPNRGHLHLVCDNFGYELSGPFTQDQLTQIAQSVCE